MKKTFIIIMATLCFAACKDTRYYRISGYAQGGTWQVKYRGARLRPEKVQAGVDSLLSEIDYTLSGYNKASLLSRLNAGDSVVLSRRFFELYGHYQPARYASLRSADGSGGVDSWSMRNKGPGWHFRSLHILVGPALRSYAEGAGDNRFPLITLRSAAGRQNRFR